jgi:hypothetical protein
MSSAAAGAPPRRLEYGIVGINEGIILPKKPAGEIAPFGGHGLFIVHAAARPGYTAP